MYDVFFGRLLARGLRFDTSRGYCRAPFSRATNFVDFLDFWTSTKIVLLKVNGNYIMTWIAD